MKHLKMLGLFAMAAAALMAFAGGASAQTFTSPAGTEYTGAFSASLVGSSLMKAGFGETTCTTGTINGNWTTNNNTEVSGSITGISFSNCGSFTIDTLNNNGTLTILKGTHSATATGVEITKSSAGVSCVYGFGTTSTPLGTTSNSGEGSTAKVMLSVNAKLPKISGGFLCASPAAWTAGYRVTSPAPSLND
jgi:hypothetical protein